MATVEAHLAAGKPFSLVDALLEEQQATAVERFAQRHKDASEPLLADHYRDLIPLSKPGPGEQYAFEVDLDSCSGCKACVAACHNLNGLDEGEQWRSVGLLHGGATPAPVMQHITTACHHCVDPACLSGCPVMAYDKDPETGIVRHLDDQCIGCQYCVFMCPYDVPQYSPSKGIVRKCDMCHDRLVADEAPACVQSCPNKAIRIRTVDQETVVRQSKTNELLPTTPKSSITQPTTIYKSAQPLPRDLLPADLYSIKSQHSHLPLVVMLVLTQLSVGVFLVSQVLTLGLLGDAIPSPGVRTVCATVGFLVGFVGMHAAVFHLGRPQFAFRAILGLRTSWLSREIVGFGIFAGCAFAYVTSLWLAGQHPWLPHLTGLLGWMTVATGVIGVFCSAMIYIKTKRPFWNGPRAGGTFFLSCIVLGAPTVMLVSLVNCYFGFDTSMYQIMVNYGQSLCLFTMASVAAKLGLEASLFWQVRDEEHTPLKRTAILLVGELRKTTILRYCFGVAGGLLLPLILLTGKAAADGPQGYPQLVLVGLLGLITVLLLLGELLERYSFFAASVSPKMPGAAGG